MTDGAGQGGTRGKAAGASRVGGEGPGGEATGGEAPAATPVGDLRAAVATLLAQNRVVAGGGRWRYTRPAPGTYPHQWLWDSCFHALLHHWLGDSAAAADELRALFRAQVASGPDRGRLPHMTFLGAEPGDAQQDPAGAAQYARDVALWRDPRASSITQPPVVAEAARVVGGPALWRELWPGLCGYYDWWLDRRRLRDGLVVCHHVWETGADATPRADAACARLLASGRRPRALDKATVNPTAHKRADLLAARFLMLEDLQAIDADEREGRVDTAGADRRRLALYGHVAIDMQAYLIANLLALAEIGEALAGLEGRQGEAAGAAAPGGEAAGVAARVGRSADYAAGARRYRREAAALAAAVNARLWDERLGIYVDLWGDPPAVIDRVTAAPLIALYAGDLVPPDRAGRLLDHLTDSHQLWTRWPVPTVSRADQNFNPDEYWRGSTWVNVNWFIVRGLVATARRTGEDHYLRAARAVARRTVALVGVVGFREYYRSGAVRTDRDASTEPAGFGPSGFGWSGLVIDLERALEQELDAG